MRFLFRRGALHSFLLSLLLASAPVNILADDSDYELNWFLLFNYSGRTGNLSPGFGDGGDYLIGEERLRLDVSAWAGSIEAEARLKLDMYHNALKDEFDVEIREAFIDYIAGDFDFRFGRQVVTWGVGAFIFINDVWPKDWVSFFSGRPMEYLKLGVDGVLARYTGNSISAEFIIVPVFQPDRMPRPDQFSFFDPFLDLRSVEEKPRMSFENAEVALRLYGRLGGFDLSAYLYKGFWHGPGMRLDDPGMPALATAFYPELKVYGASAQGAALDGIVSMEVGYYDSYQDPGGLDPTIVNSQIRFLAGYTRQLAEDFGFGVQYYIERILDHESYLSSLPSGFPATGDYRDMLTISLERRLRHQTWRLFLFAYYSPADNDYYLLPSATYKFSDSVAVTAGANIFGGESGTTFFGQFHENDNVYVSLRYDF